MKSSRCWLFLGCVTAWFGVSAVMAQSTNSTNMVITPGPLAGVAESADKVGRSEDLPAKLCSLLWPTNGVAKKLAVKKVSMDGKSEDQGLIFCLRPDNQDIVLEHYSITKPDSETKLRHEYYYRTTSQGELAVALKVDFQFAIDDVDNETLKKVTCETYGDASGDGAKPHPMTPEIKKQFEAEKKFWLAQAKNLKKQKKLPKD